MTVDDEGKKAEVQPGFLAQLQAILNVLPAYTWYAPPSGSLTFVSKRQADFLGVPKDHPPRFGINWRTVGRLDPAVACGIASNNDPSRM